MIFWNKFIYFNLPVMHARADLYGAQHRLIFHLHFLIRCQIMIQKLDVVAFGVDVPGESLFPN